MAATQRPIALACIQEKAPRPAWRAKSSWYLVTQEDRMINPATQQFLAWRMGAQTRSEKVDHAPLVTAPELVVEIVGSSRAYDLHQKKGAYRRNGIQEYLVWITDENRVLWWELREGEYRELSPDSDKLLKSRVFPGLWLDAEALVRGDMKTVLASGRRGLDSAEHAAFVAS